MINTCSNNSHSACTSIEWLISLPPPINRDTQSLLHRFPPTSVADRGNRKVVLPPPCRTHISSKVHPRAGIVNVPRRKVHTHARAPIDNGRRRRRRYIQIINMAVDVQDNRTEATMEKTFHRSILGTHR